MSASWTAEPIACSCGQPDSGYALQDNHQGRARHGTARQGAARQGEARQGKAII